jgi:SAM-dependent methyltransferase
MGPSPDGYRYHAFDGSEAMVAEARRATGPRPITYGVARFTDLVPAPPADVVVLLYDGLNYLLSEDDVAALLRNVHAALRPGGLAIIDQSTPANSENHAEGFDDAGETPAFHYVRTSRYDRDSMLHTTRFEFTTPGGETAEETHVQRAYALADIRTLVDASPLVELAALDDDGTGPADPLTERVHWVLRRPD